MFLTHHLAASPTMQCWSQINENATTPLQPQPSPNKNDLYYNNYINNHVTNVIAYHKVNEMYAHMGPGKNEFCSFSFLFDVFRGFFHSCIAPLLHCCFLLFYVFFVQNNVFLFVTRHILIFNLIRFYCANMRRGTSISSSFTLSMQLTSKSLLSPLYILLYLFSVHNITPCPHVLCFMS